MFFPSNKQANRMRSHRQNRLKLILIALLWKLERLVEKHTGMGMMVKAILVEVIGWAEMLFPIFLR